MQTTKTSVDGVTSIDHRVASGTNLNRTAIPANTQPTTTLPSVSQDDITHRETHKAISNRDKAVEIVAALAAGKLPTTAQTATALRRLSTSGAMHDAAVGLSPAGKRVVDDAEKLILTTSANIEEKNDGDLFQNVVYNSRLTAAQTKKQGNLENLGVNADVDVSSGKDAMHKFTHIARLMASSDEFRELVRECYCVARDSLTDALPVSEERKGKLKATANDAMNRTTDGRIDVADSTGRSSLPYESTSLAGTNQTLGSAAQNPSDIRGDDPSATVEDTAERMKSKAFPLVDKAINATAPHVADMKKGDASVGDKVQEAKDRARDAKGKANASLTNAMNTVSTTAKNVNLTKEQKDSLFERFKGLLIVMQNKPEYQEAIVDIQDLITHLASHAKAQADKVGPGAKETYQMPSTQTAEACARRLLENFAGGRSLQPLLDTLNSLQTDVKNDPRAKDWLKRAHTMLNATMRDPASLDAEGKKQEVTDMMDEGKDIFSREYRPRVRALSHEASGLVDGLTSDRLNKTFANDTQTLFKDFILGEDGKPAFKPELARDLASLLVRLSTQLKYIPLPRIDVIDKKMDISIDNLVLYATDVLPNQIQVRTSTALDMDPSAMATAARAEGPNQQNVAQMSTAVRFIMKQVRIEAKDVVYSVSRKVGPKVKSSGFLDILMKEGKGMNIDLVLTLGTRSNGKHYIKAEQVRIQAKGLKLKFRKTGHDILLKIFGPIINVAAKKGMEMSISQAIKDQLTPVEYRPARDPNKPKPLIRISGMSIKDQKTTELNGQSSLDAGWQSTAFDL